jgi:hypothetical protein
MTKRFTCMCSIVITAIVVIGCSTGSSTPVEKLEIPTLTIQSEAVTETIAIPTEIPTLTTTQSPIPTTALPISTITLTSEPTLTWTPLPTLSPGEADVLVMDLLENNAGCQLPCWWGIWPGETTWDEAKYYLETFASKIYAGVALPVKTGGQDLPVTGYGTRYKVEYVHPQEVIVNMFSLVS